MGVTSEQASYMDRSIATLKRDCFAAMAHVTGTQAKEGFFTFLGLGAENSSSAAVGALKMYQKMIADLEGPDRKRVEAGTSSFEWWDAKARLTHKQIRQIDSSIGDWSVAGILGRTVEQTKEDLPIPTSPLGIGLTVTLVVGVLALIAVISLAPSINAVSTGVSSG